MDNNHYLSHFGIKGMKWGVRKEKKAAERAAKEAAKSEEHRISRVIKAKPVSQMTNQELRDLTQRLQLETQLKKLNPSTVNKGYNVLKGVLAVGTTVASIYALSQSPLGKAIGSAIQKKTSRQMRMPGF